MAKTFNFNTVKKEYLTVTLPDKKKTTLMIGTPTKDLMEEMINLRELLSDTPKLEEGSQALNDLYHLVARIMSRNKGGIDVTTKDLSGILDTEDLILFIEAYSSFIGGVVESKN